MNATTLLRRWCAHLGSMRVALALMVLLAAVAAAQPGATWLGALFAALGANLCAALVVHPLLRRRLPLLLFHLALLALVLLAGLGRLLAVDGRFELLQGEPFDGRLLDDRGSVPALAQAALRNEGFTIDYAPGRRRGATRNTVTWRDATGAHSAVIGDHRPLVIDGHRVYTSPNKGFAPLLRWLPDDGGAPVVGAVHLPSYPMHELRQSREWSLPDGRTLWLALQIDDALLPADAAAQFRLPLPREHRLVLRDGERRVALAPGEQVALAGGTLVYEGLRSWMGYRVAFDPTLPWLLAAALLATAAMAWHYAALLRVPREAASPLRSTRSAHA